MTKIAIAAGSQVAADVGITVATPGGNAVDGALGAALMSMGSDLAIMAPGGSGFITICPPDGDPVVIDAYAAMPGADFPSDRPKPPLKLAHLDYGGGIQTGIGYGAVAVPGIFAGLGLAAERYGRLDWAQIVHPVAQAIAQGFPLSRGSAEYLPHCHQAIFGWHPESYPLMHHEQGEPLREGDWVRLPQLAHTLELLATEGPQSFYTGTLGKELAEEMATQGGWITATDLANYQAIAREPICFPFGDWEIITNPAPAVGGVSLAAMLLMYQAWEPDLAERRSPQVMMHIQEAVLNYRHHHLRVDQDRFQGAAEMLQLAQTLELKRYCHSPSTIHVSAVDDQGWTCSITASAGYGSGAMISGRGLWLNNSLGELELHHPDADPLVPGTRLVSNMAPTIARRPDGTVLAIGSPGASRITTALAQVLIHYLAHGDDLETAIAAPRLHVEQFGDRLVVAHEGHLLEPQTTDLPLRTFPDLSMYFGGVQATLYHPQQGLRAVADPRRRGGIAQG